MAGVVGRGDVLIGEPVPAVEGATDEGRDHPAAEVTAGLAVSLAVTRRECDEVDGAEGLATIRTKQ